MFADAGHAGRKFLRLATVAALMLVAFAWANPSAVSAKAETRVLKFYNLHTREKAAFAYKKNGRYVASEMKKINWFLRDWRKKKPTTMNPLLMDLVWEAYRQSGSNDYIHVISAYRSPATNAMLRSRSSGVAKQSQHTLGNALDFYIPDVPLKRLRQIGLKMQIGGVGYYPKSGSPFVHLDVGSARHWPRMSRRELAAVFPNGNTVHVPSDGKPLPGYQQALASYKKRKGQAELAVANASSSGGGRTLLAMLFGGGEDEAEDEAEAVAAPAPLRARPAQRPANVAAGARAVAAADGFDTSSPEDDGTQFAAIDPSRVPVPTFRPVRQNPSSQDIQSNPDAVAAMVAELEKQADDPEIATQLAYAVPTPRPRPLFETVLANEAADQQPLPAAEDAVATAGTSSPESESVMAYALPRSRPEQAVSSALLTEAAATTTAEKKAAPSAEPDVEEVRVAALAASKTVAAKPAAAEASNTGKGGRVLDAVSAAPQSRRIVPQEAIAARFDVVASLEGPSARPLKTRQADTSELIGDPSRTLYAAGFAPAGPRPASNRFTGSAVTFLPVVKTGR